VNSAHGCCDLGQADAEQARRGRIRRFDDWGDFSYGVYIYAFPIQQTLANLFPVMSLAAMMASSALASLAVAIASWKLIEKRALEHKDDFAAATSRLFSVGLAKIAAAVR